MNNRRIGFDRELDLNWLDLTAGLALEGLDVQQLRQRLTDRLANEIPGREACRKTVTVLARIWSRVPQEQQALHLEGLNLLSHIPSKDRLWLHWGMSLLAYPFFHDVAATVGRLLRLQGEFGSAQVKRRMRESWGQRTTLERAVRRVLQTYVAWDVILESPSMRHVYEAASTHQTSEPTLALWFLECVLRSTLGTSNSEGAIPLMELIQSPVAFPFDLAGHAVAIRHSDRFEISRQGLDLEMVAPRI